MKLKQLNQSILDVIVNANSLVRHVIKKKN